MDGERLAPLGLLASAISGRALQVAPGEPGEPAWTDGRTIFVDPDTSTRRQIEALAVQASLLAAGSLHPDVVRRLTWRAALARRYLAVEGHRALAAIEDLLPPSLRTLIDFDVAARADSPAASLAFALSREPIADPPECFGAIRTRPLLASIQPAHGSAATREHAPLERRNPVLAELARDEDEDARRRGSRLEPRRRRRCGRPLAAAAADGGAPARRRWLSGRRRADAPGADRNARERSAPPSRRRRRRPSKRPPAQAEGRSIPNGTFIDGAIARTGAACRRSSPGRRTAHPSWCRTATACADRSPVSAWASIVIAGRRRATTSTSMRPSRRASS